MFTAPGSDELVVSLAAGTLVWGLIMLQVWHYRAIRDGDWHHSRWRNQMFRWHNGVWEYRVPTLEEREQETRDNIDNYP